jgi:hypothetical protein
VTTAAYTLTRTRSRLWFILAGLVVFLVAAPFALNLAGDAQVHLAIAENFVRGLPFRYNPAGEIVVASTSPFWTMMLALFYRLAGDWAPALLVIAVFVFWLAAGYVLYVAGRELWGFRGPALWAVVLLWLGHTTLVANALGGLENIASALQLLLLYSLLAGPEPFTPRRSAATGLVLGWAMLTRPDGGLFALLLVGLAAIRLLVASPAGWRAGVARLGLVALVAVAVVVPWYFYQYAVTGRVLTDSSVARLYNGRMGSLLIIPNMLYLHLKAFISLVTGFLPLVFGFLWTASDLALRLIGAVGSPAKLYQAEFPRIAAVVLLIAGFLFYTFIVGAEAFGRYFLPLFPFFILAGVAGLILAYEWLAARGRRTVALALIALAALFLVATSALDYYRRLGPGRFTADSALDVIYGPAGLRYYSANVPQLVAAPRSRPAVTEAFLADLGAAGGPVSIAVTEVQLRYFLDDRVTVLSLDGRTSADVLDYVDPTSGVPDFERYFLATRPDYVHAAQWCAVGGWLASVFSSDIAGNLVCDWEQRAATMQPGEGFVWQGRPVTLVAPAIFQIDWEPEERE